MSSGGKYWVHLWGGLGDFLKMYYSQNQWRRLESIKKKNPNVTIKALVYSLNPAAKDLIEYHPAIDEVFQPEGGLIEVRSKGIPSYADGYTPLVHQKALIKQAKRSTPVIYLSDEDKSQVQQVIGSIAGKFVVIHPFSAMPPHVPTSRTTMTADKYIPIIEGLGKKGIKSVILGAGRPNRQEKFDYESEHTVNLIDKTSVRSALRLVSRSDGFIGTNSCFMCEAMLERKSCFVVTSYFWENRIHKNGFIANGLKNTRSTFRFLPKNRNKAPYAKIQREAINWFK